jgi:transcriptional regulator GlxA family with amidase domain
MLPERRLAALRAAALGGDGRQTPDASRLENAAARRLAAYLAFLFDGVIGPDGPRTGAAALDRILALLEDLIADVAAGWGARPADAAAALRRVRMAEEIMRVRSAEPLAMHEVAQTLGIGLRSLQLAFRSVRGEEPRATLTRIRLDAARARLLAADPGDNVTAIALDCGFTHLSRFAAAYRRAFGERPGETLSRRR